MFIIVLASIVVATVFAAPQNYGAPRPQSDIPSNPYSGGSKVVVPLASVRAPQPNSYSGDKLPSHDKAPVNAYGGSLSGQDAVMIIHLPKGDDRHDIGETPFSDSYGGVKPLPPRDIPTGNNYGGVQPLPLKDIPSGNNYGAVKPLPPKDIPTGNNYGAKKTLDIPSGNNYGAPKDIPSGNNYGAVKPLPLTKDIPSGNNYDGLRPLPPSDAPIIPKDNLSVDDKSSDSKSSGDDDSDEKPAGPVLPANSYGAVRPIAPPPKSDVPIADSYGGMRKAPIIPRVKDALPVQSPYGN